MAEPAVVITHGDVNGMVCAAQLIRREKGRCEVLFSSARWIAGKLEQVAQRKPLPERLYVTDIPANAHAAGWVERMVEAGVDVFWIDHHPLSEDGILERLSRACETVVYNESTSTPAGVLLGRWLGKEDPYCEQVAGICYAYEKGTEWERDWFRLLASQVGNAGVDVLGRLAFDQPHTQQDRLRIQEQRDVDDLAEKLLSEPPRTVTTADGKTMAVYDTSAMPRVFLGQKVFQRHDVDYCMIRISKGKWQIASNPDRSLPLRRLMGRHRMEGMEVEAAGRPDQLLAVEVIAPVPPPAESHERMAKWAHDLL